MLFVSCDKEAEDFLQSVEEELSLSCSLEKIIFETGEKEKKEVASYQVALWF